MKEKLLLELEKFLMNEERVTPKVLEKARMLFETTCRVCDITGSTEQDRILHQLYFQAALEEIVGENEFIRFMKIVPLNIYRRAYNLQDALFAFIDAANDSDDPYMKNVIQTDNHELFFHDEETWKKAVDFFDVLGLDFATGEPDGDNTWYVNFEFSGGVVSRH